MRVLITGGAGFIGSNLARACLEAGDEVRILDDFSTGRRENLRELLSDVELYEASIADPSAVARALEGCEGVYHQAAIPSVQRSVDDPLATHEANLTATLVVLEGARRAHVERVVYAASSSAYGDTEALPKREDMPARPLSPYALQKYASEVYCMQYARLFELETVALRYFNVFGPRQDPSSDYAAVIPRFISALAKGRPPTIFGDGLQSRDFTYVGDVVAANRAAAAAPAKATGQVFNVGCGGRSTLLELVSVIAEVLGIEDVEPLFEPVRPGDVRHSQADISRARECLGWSPKVSLREGIARTVEFMAQARSGRA